MKVRTYNNGEEWEIEFSNGVQTFSLEYKIEDKKSAEIMAGQLSYALDDFKKQEVRKFADWLKKYKGIDGNTTAEFQVRQYFNDIKSGVSDNSLNEIDCINGLELLEKAKKGCSIFPIEFIEWYSGMKADKIESALKRWLNESK